MSGAQLAEPWVTTDSRGRVIDVVAHGFESDVIQSTQYDWRGRLVYEGYPYRDDATTMPGGVSYRYDALDRPVRIEGEVLTRTFTYAGRRVTMTEKGGAIEHYRVTDDVGNVVESGTSSAPTCRVYGAFDELAKIVRGSTCAGAQTARPQDVVELRRDSQGRVIWERDGAIGDVPWTAEYDTTGNMTKLTRPDGQVDVFVYDELGRKVQENRGGEIAKWTWDTATIDGQLRTWYGGLLESNLGGKASRRFGHDSFGRVVEEQYEYKGPRTRYEYDVFGRLGRLWYPTFDGETPLYAEYEYDAAGDVEVLKAGPARGGPVEIWRKIETDSRDRMTAELFSNDVETRKVLHPDRNAPMIISSEVQAAGASKLIQSYTLGVAADGWRILGEGDVIAGVGRGFGYDGAGRLSRVSVNGGGASDALYTPGGDVSKNPRLGNVTVSPGLVTTDGGRRYELDVNGNLARVLESGVETRSYEYTGAGRLWRATDDVGGAVEYSYDADGNVVRRDSETEIRLYYGGLVEEARSMDESTAPVAGTTLFNFFVGSRVVAQGVAVDAPGESGLSLRFLHEDVRGSLDAISYMDGSFERVEKFDAWGYRDEGPEGPEMADVGFTGHPARTDGGLIRMGVRMYDPELGRFVQPDPLRTGGVDGAHPYVYAMNDPINFTDPTGMCASGSDLTICSGVPEGGGGSSGVGGLEIVGAMWLYQLWNDSADWRAERREARAERREARREKREHRRDTRRARRRAEARQEALRAEAKEDVEQMVDAFYTNADREDDFTAAGSPDWLASPVEATPYQQMDPTAPSPWVSGLSLLQGVVEGAAVGMGARMAAGAATTALCGPFAGGCLIGLGVGSVAYTAWDLVLNGGFERIADTVNAAAAGDAEALRAAGQAIGGALAGAARGSGGRAAAAPVGGRGQHLNVATPAGRTAANSPARIGNRDFTGHALDRMQGQGIPPSAVESAIRPANAIVGKRPGTMAYYDSANNLTVITDTASGRVVTVDYGRIVQ